MLMYARIRTWAGSTMNSPESRQLEGAAGAGIHPGRDPRPPGDAVGIDAEVVRPQNTWVCMSMRPGVTMCPVASTTSAAVSSGRRSSIAVTTPSVTAMSRTASMRAYGSMSRPPRTMVSKRMAVASGLLEGAGRDGPHQVPLEHHVDADHGIEVMSMPASRAG